MRPLKLVRILFVLVLHWIPLQIVAKETQLPAQLDIQEIHSESAPSVRLLKTGESVRRILFVSIYRMAHYMPSLSLEGGIFSMPPAESPCQHRFFALKEIF